MKKIFVVILLLIIVPFNANSGSLQITKITPGAAVGQEKKKINPAEMDAAPPAMPTAENTREQSPPSTTSSGTSDGEGSGGEDGKDPNIKHLAPGITIYKK